MDTLISVIIPMLNAGKYIGETLEYWLKQTYQNYEILVIDDGSEDDSVLVVEEISHQNEKVKLYHSSGKGVSTARNTGILLSKGDYIIFGDADDVCEHTLIKEYVNTIQKNNYDLLISGYYFDVPNLTSSGYDFIENSGTDLICTNKKDINDHMLELWDLSLMYNVWNKAYSRSLIIDNNIFFPVDKEFNEDRDFNRKYISICNSIVCISSCFYHYRREIKGSATEIYRKDMISIRQEEYGALKDFFISIDMWNEKTEEYVSRQHIERVYGIAADLFHSNSNRKEIKSEIKRLLSEPVTIRSITKSIPKSKKMEIITKIWKTQNVTIIYFCMFFINSIRDKCPILFHRLKQRR